MVSPSHRFDLNGRRWIVRGAWASMLYGVILVLLSVTTMCRLFSEKRHWIGREWLVNIYVYCTYICIYIFWNMYIYMYIYKYVYVYKYIYIHICIEIWYTQIIMLHNEAAQVQTFSRSFMATRNHREPSFETLGMITPINVTGRNISTQRTMGICSANLSKSLSSPGFGSSEPLIFRHNGILLMEEILHQVGYIKPCKQWEKLLQ